MRGIKALLVIPMAAVLLLAGACTNNGYDDGASADVVLEVLGFTNPPVTASLATDGLCSATTTTVCMADADCPATETCVFGCSLTVVDWAVSLANVPKSTLAAGPANDIVMIDVGVTYAGLTPVVMPTAFGLGGQVIPTGGSGSVTFQPIRLNDLDPGHESSTASLFLTFSGQTQEGTAISMTVARDLAIEECE